MENEQWCVKNGVWRIEHEEWRKNGEWNMRRSGKKGEWRMVYGVWFMESGVWNPKERMENRKCCIRNGAWGKRTECEMWDIKNGVWRMENRE